MAKARDSVVFEKFAGLANYTRPERMAPGELVRAENVDIDETGQITRRDGFAQVYAGAVHSLFVSGPLALFVDGGTLKRLNPGYTATALRTGLADAPMSWCPVVDTVYFSNHVDTGIVQNGAARSWGLPQAPLPHASLSTGLMPAGDYQFALIWIRSDGQEGGCGVAGRITVPEGGGITFTLPTAAGDADVTHKALFLSTTNGDQLYRVAVLPLATASLNYIGDTSELSVPLQTQLLGPAPAGQLVAYHHGQVVVADGHILYPSLPHAYELFDLRMGIECDGQVTLFASVEGEGAFVGTDSSITWVQGTGDLAEGQWSQRTGYGAIAGTLQWVEGTNIDDGSLGARLVPVWLSQQGLCAGLPGGQVRNLTRTRYQFTATGRGCSLYRPATNHLVAVTAA